MKLHYSLAALICTTTIFFVHARRPSKKSLERDLNTHMATATDTIAPTNLPTSAESSDVSLPRTPAIDSTISQTVASQTASPINGPLMDAQRTPEATDSSPTVAPTLNQPIVATPTQPITPSTPIAQHPIPAPTKPTTQKVTYQAISPIAPSVTEIETTDPEINKLLTAGNEGFDVKAKRAQVKSVVNRAVDYFKTHSLDDSLNAFLYDPQFTEGELYIFVHDYQGNTLVNGPLATDLVWKNLWELKDKFNTFVIQEIINAAKERREWVTYYWNGATKISYVQEVSKDGVNYAIGCGYYPHSKDDQVVGLVKGAVALFNNLVNKMGYPSEEAFSSFTYPIGRFVYGDLYIYALDFSGHQVAHGDRPGLIGTNAWTYKDSKGKLVNQEIIRKLKESNGAGVWVDYYSKGARKLAYAEKVVDHKKKIEYFIACGYYPTVTREIAIDLVKRAYEYMKRQGKSRAVEAFSSKRDDTFRYGDLAVFVFTDTGVSVADGVNSDLIGSNQWDWRDDDGVAYVQEMVKKSKEGGGWLNLKLRNSFESLYVEPIELGLEKYVIATSFFPVSKRETALLLVKSAVTVIKANSEIEAMRTFTKPGSFLRGDLHITVYNADGIVLADGDNDAMLWKNMFDAKDATGKPYVRMLINGTRRGPVQLAYTINGVQKKVFAEQVERDGNVYVVVSGFYL